MLHHVDPHITDQFDAFRDALLFQVVYRDLRGSQQQLTEVVSDDPVDFLGHSAIVAAQASFDMCDGDLQFGSGKGTRQRRIRVAKHEDPIRLLLQHFGFESHEHGAGLGRVASSADPQIVFGLRQAQLVEEDPRHVVVEMLPGMHEDFSMAATNRGGDRRELDELRSSSNDGQDLHCGES